MSIHLQQSALPEVFPIPAQSDHAPNQSAKSTGGEFDAAGRSFASRLIESQGNTNGRKNSSDAARTKRENDKIQITGNPTEQDDAPGHTPAGVISNSSLLKAAQEEMSAREVFSGQSKYAMPFTEVLLSDQMIMPAGLEEVSTEEKQAVFGNAELVSAISSKGVAPVSELIDLAAPKIQSEIKSDAQIAKLLFDSVLIDKEVVETKGSSTADIAKDPLFSVSGDGVADNGPANGRSTAKAAPIHAPIPASITGSAKQSQITELFQRFDIESAELSKSASASEHGAKMAVEELASKSAFTDLRPLALPPNIRRILKPTTQAKQNHMIDRGEAHIESETLAPGGPKAISMMNATSSELYNAFQNTGGQNALTSFMLNGDPNAALLEEFSVLVTEGAKVNLDLASEAIQRKTDQIPLRASFTLPERFGQTLRSGVKSITLQITPKHLGSAQLSVNVINDRVSGVLFVESSAAKAAVEASIEQLVNRLAEEGLSLEKLEVEVSERHRGRDEFGAEKRGASDNDATSERSSAEDMASKPVIDDRAIERRSIITATRIDAVV